jgi:hypothetical protein
MAVRVRPRTAGADVERLRPWPIAGNLIILVVLLVAAELLPRLAPHHDLATGVANARRILDAEAALGLPDEGDLSRWLAARPALADLANVVYVGLHVPAMAATFVWLYLTRPRPFAQTRTAFVAAMALTVAGYVLLPTAPPRFLPGVADGAEQLYGSAARPSGDGAINALAAFPSGHVVFALLAALPVVRYAGRRPIRLVAAAYPPFVVVLVVASAHHFWLDAAGGVLVVLLATGVAAVVHRDR